MNKGCIKNLISQSLFSMDKRGINVFHLSTKLTRVEKYDSITHVELEKSIFITKF